MSDSAFNVGGRFIYAPTGGEFLTYAANATLSAERVIAASDNITIVSSGTSFLISANTGAGGSSVVYAATDNKYVVMDLATDLTNEFRLVQSGNSITVTTAAGLITINAVTGGGGVSTISKYSYRQVNSGNLGPTFTQYHLAGFPANSSLNPTSATAFLGANSAYCQGFLVESAVFPIDRMLSRITSSGVNSLIRYGIYTNSATSVLCPHLATYTSEIIAVSNTVNAIVFSTMNLTLSSNTLYWCVIHVGSANLSANAFQNNTQQGWMGVDTALGQMYSYLTLASEFSNGLPSTFPTENLVARGNALDGNQVLLYLRGSL